MDNMLRGYDFVKSQKRGKEFGISKKTGGNEGMKKERKRVLLAWIMAIAMLAGVLQPLTGFSDVQAQESKSAQSKEAVQYEALPKEPMKSSATASSYQDSAQWGDGNASLAFDGDVNKGWHSQYDSKTGPHWIQWSLGGTYEIGRIGYRVKGNGANGRFKDIKVEVKNGDTDWAVVKQETLQDVGQGGTSNIDFEPVQATDVRITISSSYNTNETGVLASAGEIDVYKAVPDLTATDVYHVTYYWEDQDNLAEVRPNKVAPTLVDESSPYYRAETQYGNATVSPGPISQGYQYTFKKVPRYNKRGELAQWKLNPGIYSTNYQIQTEKTGDREFRATYTLNTRKQDKTIRVDWAGADAANRPAIKLQLMYQKWDGSSVSPVEGTEAITLDAANNYTYTWKDMVEYESGKEAFPYQPIYSIEELEAIDGYDIAYSTEKNSKGVYPFNTDGQLVITCTSTTPAAVVTVKVNGQETGGASLEDAVAKAGITADQVTSLEFVSGTVAESDMRYIKSNVNQIQEFKCNLKDGLTYVKKDGKESTVFPAWTFSKKDSLTSAELGGFTEIASNAFSKAANLTSVQMNDVQKVGSSAFSGAAALTEVNLPNATYISTWAFAKTPNLTTVHMPNVQTIREAAFWGSGYRNITLPKSLKNLHYAVFGTGDSMGQPGPEVEFHVVMEGTTPPKVQSGNNEPSPFKDAAPTSTLEVPEGSEDTYLKSEQGNEQKRTWCNLPLKTEEPIANVTVKIGTDASGADAREMSGASLEDIVKQSGWNPSFEVDYLEFVSGTVREQDIVYANANLFGLKTLKLNLNDQLTYETVKGVPSTTFPAYAFRGTVKLVSVELDGFTALGTGAFIGQNYMTSIRIPNVEEIAASAFQLCTGLKNVDLPSVKKIKDSAFSSTALETVNMPVVEEIGALTFRDSGLTEIHIPATIKRFNYHTFGYEKASEDNAPIHFIIDAIDPPVASGYVPFVNCPQDSYITVPEGREEAYLKSYAGDEENGTWHGISIGQKVKEASVTFDVDGTQTVVKVPVGEAIGDRLPEEPKKDGFFFKGWYKAQDGSGEEVTANTIIEEDMTVYAVFTVELNVKAACSNVEETGEVIPTNQDVTVTLTANSSIQDIEGWTRVSDTVLTKAYSQNGTYSVTVVSNDNQQKEVTYTVAGIDKQAPTFQWIVDNSKLEQSKEVRLETSEEIQLPGEGWSLKGQENGTYVYVKTFTANWKDKAFTVTDLAGNVSKPQFVEVKRIDNTKPAVVELTQDITDWTKKDVTVTIKTSVDCATPEGWKKVNKRTFTKVFTASGEYRVTLTSATGVTGDAYVFSITNIDKEAPVIDYAAIEAAKGYKREIPLNEGEEYTEEQLTEMFTKPEWVKDNSGTAAFKVDKWGLEHGLDGYQPFTSKTPGEYKVRFYAYDAAGNSSSFDVYVKVLEPEVPEVEERTTTVNYTVFVDHRVRTGQWTHTGTETGEFTFDLSMVKYLPSNYKLAEGETGYRVLQYGDTTAVTFYLTTE